MATKIFRKLLLAISVACVSPLSIAAGDIVAGEKLYLDQGCYSCHGYNGTGRTPLVGGASGIMTNEDLFVRFLRLRGEQDPLPPSNSMPSYSADVLPDEAARDIYAYISSLSDDPPAVEDIDVFVDLIERTAKEKSESE